MTIYNDVVGLLVTKQAWFKQAWFKQTWFKQVHGSPVMYSLACLHSQKFVFGLLVTKFMLENVVEKKLNLQWRRLKSRNNAYTIAQDVVTSTNGCQTFNNT